ncbi:MAG: peptidylprolyl isomerase [Betaproteobacteria bacterium]
MIRSIPSFSAVSCAVFASLFMTAALAQKPAEAPAKVAAKATGKTSACKFDDKGNTAMKVKLTTSMGPIVLELNKEKAPLSTENFIKYVESGHYNGTIFHRVIGNFMVQGGGFDKNMAQKPTNAPIKNEATNGLKNDNYTVAMARTGVVDSATAQFFINVSNNDFLNHSGPANYGYAVFGKVVEGQDVVDKIKGVKTGAKGMFPTDVPQETVMIEKAECIQ